MIRTRFFAQNFLIRFGIDLNKRKEMVKIRSVNRVMTIRIIILDRRVIIIQ